MECGLEEWYVAQYKPNQASIAKQNLENQGITTFLPLIKVTRRTKTKFVTKSVALFPGYIFLYFNVNYFRWTSVNNTRGLTRILSTNKCPQIVPKDFISALKMRCNIDGVLFNNTEIPIGQKAEVLSGPFSKMIGLVSNIEPQARVTLLFDILGHPTKISLQKTFLKEVL